MNELVYRKENQALTNSRLVAMKFGKRHSDVIRAIEDLLIKLPENERKRNFAQLEEDVEISNGGSKKLKFYAMTETGFTLLVMGFTGEKAIQFKLEYIAAFNKMKEIIKRASLPSYQIDDPIKRAEKWIEEQKEKKALETKVEELSIENKKMEKRIEEDTPKVIFANGRNRIQTILSCCGACKDNLSKRNGDRTKQIIQVVKKERLSGNKRRILQSAYATLCRSRIV